VRQRYDNVPTNAERNSDTACPPSGRRTRPPGSPGPTTRSHGPANCIVVLPIYARMVAALAGSETVHINVNDEAMEDQARRLLHAAGAQGDIRFHHFPTNDAWCRDHGAIFVVRAGE
jgi:agmatine deiminase